MTTADTSLRDRIAAVRARSQSSPLRERIAALRARSMGPPRPTSIRGNLEIVSAAMDNNPWKPATAGPIPDGSVAEPTPYEAMDPARAGLLNERSGGAYGRQARAASDFGAAHPFVAGVRQGYAQAAPPGLRTQAAETFAENANPTGAAAFVGQQVGGLAGSTVNPATWPEFVVGGEIGGMTVRAAKPILGKVASVAGEKVANLLGHTLNGASQGGLISGLHEATQITPEEWAANPLASLERVAAAAGVGTAVGGAMGAAGGRTAPSEGGSMALRSDQTRANIRAMEPVRPGQEFVADAAPLGGPRWRPSAEQAGPPVPEGFTPAPDWMQNIPEVPRGTIPEPTPTTAPVKEVGPKPEPAPTEAKQTTVPETRGTLRKQLFLVQAGKRPAMLVTPGAESPPVPKGLQAHDTPAGRFIFDPERMTAEALDAAVREDRIGKVLGYGVDRKPEPGTEAGAVVVRDSDGAEVQAVIADKKGIRAAVEAAKKIAGPGDTVGIEDPVKVVEERLSAAKATTPESTPLEPVAPPVKVPAKENLGGTEVEVVHTPKSTPNRERAGRTSPDLSPGEAPPKQPWEMTRGEWQAQAKPARVQERLSPESRSNLASSHRAGPRQRESTHAPAYFAVDGVDIAFKTAKEARERGHRRVVEKALSEGRPVPPEVLADYPDLKGPHAEAQAQVPARPRAAGEAGTAVPADKPDPGTLSAVDLRRAAVEEGVFATGPKNREELIKRIREKRASNQPVDVPQRIDAAPAPKPPAQNVGKGKVVPKGDRATGKGAGKAEQQAPKGRGLSRPKMAAKIEDLANRYGYEAVRSHREATIGEDGATEGDSSGMFVFYKKLPTEIKTAIEGKPQLRTVFRVSQRAEGANGADYLSRVGSDRMIEEAEAVHGNQTRQQIEHLESSGAGRHDSNVQFWLDLYHRMETEPETLKTPKETISNPGMLPTGTTMKIGGETYTVKLDAKGEKVLEDGNTYDHFTYFDDIPVDKGSLVRGDGSPLYAEGVTPEAAPSMKPTERGLLGQPITERATGRQNEMVFETEGRTADAKPERTDATERKIEAKFDEAATDPLFDADLAKFADKLEAKGKAIRARNQIKPGKNTGSAIDPIAEVVGLSYQAAAKAIRIGSKTAKSIKAIVEELLADAPEAIKARAGDIRRLARQIVRGSRDAEGRFDESLLEKTIGETETRIAEATRKGAERAAARGEKDSTPAGMAALVENIREKAKSETKAVREGLERLDAALPALLDRLSKKALTTKLRAEVKAAKAAHAEGFDAATVIAKEREGVRREVARLVRENVPGRMQGRFLGAIADAKTFADLRNAITRMRDSVATAGLDDAIAGAKRAGKKEYRRKLFADHRKMYDEARANLKRVITAAETKELTPEQKNALRDEARALRNDMIEARHLSASQRQVMVQGRVLLRERVVRKGVKAIEASGKEIAADPDLPTTRKAGLMGRVHHAHLTPDGVGAMLSDPDLRSMLSEDAWDAETKVSGGVFAAYDGLKSWVEAAGFKWGGDAVQRLSASVAGKDAIVHTFDLPDAGKVKMTPAESMALYATMTDGKAGPQIEKGTPINFVRDPRGEPVRLTPEDLAAITEQIPERLRKIVDKAKSHVEKAVRPEVFRAFREMKGYDLEAVPNYWRTRRNRTQVDPKGVIETMRVHFNRALENLGFLKERVPDSKTPFLIGDFFQDFSDIVHQGMVVAHMTRVVRNSEMVFQDPRMTGAIEARFGDGMNKRVGRIIEAQKLLFVEPRTTAEKVAAGLNRNMARSLLTLNPSTMLKQPGGILKLAAYIDPKYLAIGAKKAASKATRAEMMKSTFLRDRYESAIWRRVTPAQGERTPLIGPSAIKDTLARMLSPNPKKVLGAVGELVDRIELLNWFDQTVAATAWEAKKAEALDLMPKATDAERLAWVEKEVERIIRRTQNTHSPLDMSGAAESHRANPLASAYLLFTSDANKSYNMLADGLYDSPKQAARAATAVALNNAWAAAVSTLIRVGVPTAAVALAGRTPKEDKRKDGAVATFTKEFARNMAGIWYGGSELADVAVRAVDVMMGNPYMPYTVPISTPAGDAINDLIGSLDKLWASTKGGEFASGPRKGQSKAVGYALDALEQGGMAGARMLGLPLEPLYRLEERVRKAIRDSEP